ncbi:MAG: DUF4399 domain-containing protein [Proteobacteria bacterium]|nr:DUF4399 domain-containing protein [Pseudomonadota bacterium]MDA1034088.1 DUF4399 domain-containing protein [Pseudomonadota bacterium]
MKNYFFINLVFLLGFFALPLHAVEKSIASDDAELYIISPTDGEVVSSPVKIVFGLNGMGVAPAGIKYNNTGHHHLLIDVPELPDINLPIPSDEHHKHFGKGQTETVIELESGEHSLQLILGDHVHVPHDPVVVSKKIKINVVP